MTKNIQGYAILENLLNGNKDFVNGELSILNHQVDTLKQLKNQQHPDAMIFTCSDSRISPEIIFNCGVGKLFTIKTAGLAIDDNVIETIEYGIEKLKIKLLILLGHDNCGAIETAKKYYPQKGHFDSLVNGIYPVITSATISTNDLAKTYTKSLENTLINKSDIIKTAIKDKNLLLIKAHLNHDTGIVEILE